MADAAPPPQEFATAFMEFMRVMSEAAGRSQPQVLERLAAHLETDPGELPVTSAQLPISDRPNLQLALDAVLPEREAIGLMNHHMHRAGASFSQLLAFSRSGPDVAQPVEHVDVELGDGRVVRCMTSALLLSWLAGAPIALIVTQEQGPPRGQIDIHLEAISPAAERPSELIAALRRAMLEQNVFRGKTVSFTADGHVTFPAIPHVRREDVILPEGTLERLERHAIGIAEQADRLRASHRHLKRGILLHGPPGTGKTLTVNYLLSAMAGRTTVILTGQALGMIGPAFSVARELTPATVILEDVDLVAAERTMPGGHGVLFELLNELEGLREDADLLVLLTTNRPDRIEPALAARPGRVDLAMELPLPEAEERRRLFALYAGSIPLDPETEGQLVEGSRGVTGALIKELMRQATLKALLDGSEPCAADVASILRDLQEDRSSLTRRLLGQPPEGVEGEPNPSPSMLRALTAAGMPVPPHLRPAGP